MSTPALSSRGTIDGNGYPWWACHCKSKAAGGGGLGSEEGRCSGDWDKLYPCAGPAAESVTRGHLIEFMHSSDIEISNLVSHAALRHALRRLPWHPPPTSITVPKTPVGRPEAWAVRMVAAHPTVCCGRGGASQTLPRTSTGAAGRGRAVARGSPGGGRLIVMPLHVPGLHQNLRNSPFWTVHPFDCQHVTIRNIDIWAPVSSRRVHRAVCSLQRVACRTAWTRPACTVCALRCVHMRDGGAATARPTRRTPTASIRTAAATFSSRTFGTTAATVRTRAPHSLSSPLPTPLPALSGPSCLQLRRSARAG